MKENEIEAQNKFLLDTLAEKANCHTIEEVKKLKGRLEIQTILLTDTKKRWRLILDNRIIGVQDYESVFKYDGP